MIRAWTVLEKVADPGLPLPEEPRPRRPLLDVLADNLAGGKKRMKRVGAVEIPQEAFMAVLSLDD